MNRSRRPRDIAQLAFAVVEEATDETAESFEDLAREFWEDTQIVAPGQEIHPPLVDKWGEEKRWEKWRQWLVRRKLGGRKTGRAGGLRGGPARALLLSPERRREIAQKAAAARWSKTPAND